MKGLLGLLIAILSLTSGIVSYAEEEYVIYDGNKLSDGYELGVDTSEKRRDWLKNLANEIEMSYPEGQSWGAVFFTVGKPIEKLDLRESQDFSKFDFLEIAMKGANGGESVDIGIKDNTDKDDGSETKINKILSDQYSTYRFHLKNFKTADLSELHVVTEFVFSGASPTTIYVNSIKFKCGKDSISWIMNSLLLND